MFLFYDTETTGLVNHKMGPHPAQPGIVQFACCLFDEHQKEVASVNLLVQPRCFISTRAQDTHGISKEVADRYGVSESMAVAAWDRLAERAEWLVAHNEVFDWVIMESARLHHRVDRRGATMEKRFCTMKAAKDVVQIPPTEKMVKAGFTHFKNPSLGECYQHFFEEKLEGAHDALVDVRACAKVYFKLRDLGIDMNRKGEK